MSNNNFWEGLTGIYNNTIQKSKNLVDIVKTNDQFNKINKYIPSSNEIYTYSKDIYNELYKSDTLINENDIKYNKYNYYNFDNKFEGLIEKNGDIVLDICLYYLNLKLLSEIDQINICIYDDNNTDNLICITNDMLYAYNVFNKNNLMSNNHLKIPMIEYFPICCLQNKKIKIVLKIKNNSDININNIYYIVNYGYLDTKRKNKLIESELIIPYNYIHKIEQTSNKISIKCDMNVKDILFFTNNKFIKNICLQINGNNEIDWTPSHFFSKFIPLKEQNINLKDNYYMYSFRKEKDFSEFDNVYLKFDCDNIDKVIVYINCKKFFIISNK